MNRREDIYIKASDSTGFPVKVVKEAYEMFWEFYRKKIEELPMKDISVDEYPDLRTSFNVPSIGKICCTPERFKALKENYKLKQELYERDKAYEDGDSCIQQDNHDSKQVQE